MQDMSTLRNELMQLDEGIAVDFFVTSAKDGRGVADVFQKVAQRVHARLHIAVNSVAAPSVPRMTLRTPRVTSRRAGGADGRLRIRIIAFVVFGALCSCAMCMAVCLPSTSLLPTASGSITVFR
jgi:hypothetical protein